MENPLGRVPNCCALKYSNHQSIQSVFSFMHAYTNSRALEINAFVTY